MKICIVVTDIVMKWYVTCGHNIIYDMTLTTEQ